MPLSCCLFVSGSLLITAVQLQCGRSNTTTWIASHSTNRWLFTDVAYCLQLLAVYCHQSQDTPVTVIRTNEQISWLLALCICAVLMTITSQRIFLHLSIIVILYDCFAFKSLCCIMEQVGDIHMYCSVIYHCCIKGDTIQCFLLSFM